MRSPRFRLRTLLAGVLVVSLPFGWLAAQMSEARKESRAVAEFNSFGMYVVYNDSLARSSDSRFDLSAAPSAATMQLEKRLKTRGFGRVIALNGQNLRDEERLAGARVSTLAKIADLSHLQQLNFDHTPLGDADLVHFRSLHRLRTLYLWGTNVGDEGMRHLADLTELRFLGLQSTRVSDAGVGHLRKMKNLETLNLRYTRVTVESIRILVTLGNLRYLDVSDTLVSKEGAERLRKALPDTYVHRLEP
jgi:hypothetical protein